MLIKHYKSGKQLWDEISLYPINNREGLDFIKQDRASSYINVITADSLHGLRVDLSHLGFTPSRWNRFINQYFPTEEYDSWLKKVSTLYKRKGRLDIYLPCKETSQHKGGNCVLGFSFHAGVEPRLTIFSRTSLFPTTGILELTMAYLISRDLEDFIKSPVKFAWFIGTLQWRFLHMVPYVFMNRRELIQKHPFLRHTWWRLFTSENKLKYGPIIRIQKSVSLLKEGAVKPIMSTGLKLR